MEGREPPDALVVHADGSTTWRGQPIGPAEAVARSHAGEADTDNAMRLVPDRDLPAKKLLEIADDLRRNGAKRIFIVTERGLD